MFSRVQCLYPTTLWVSWNSAPLTFKAKCSDLPSSCKILDWGAWCGAWTPSLLEQILYNYNHPPIYASPTQSSMNWLWLLLGCSVLPDSLRCPDCSTPRASVSHCLLDFSRSCPSTWCCSLTLAASAHPFPLCHQSSSPCIQRFPNESVPHITWLKCRSFSFSSVSSSEY